MAWERSYPERSGRAGRRSRRRTGRRFLSLLEAEAEAVALRVERDDLEVQRLTFVDDVAGMGDALVRELTDVDETFEAILDADESLRS